MTIIAAEDLVYDYPRTRALDGVSFAVARGTITALVGPNGAGKTTALRLLVGLLTPTSGEAWLGGHHVLRDGIEAKRINTISFGKERPFVLGHDETAWKWNRRAHFISTTK